MMTKGTFSVSFHRLFIQKNERFDNVFEVTVSRCDTGYHRPLLIMSFLSGEDSIRTKEIQASTMSKEAQVNERIDLKSMNQSIEVIFVIPCVTDGKFCVYLPIVLLHSEIICCLHKQLPLTLPS